MDYPHSSTYLAGTSVHTSAATYSKQHFGGTAGAAERGAESDPRSIGLELDDPAGYLRVEQMVLGPGSAVITRLSSTGYTAHLNDPDNFTFVVQRAGLYSVRISDCDYSMSPGSVLAFRPNKRQSFIRPGKTGQRSGVTLQLSVARMNALAEAMDTTTIKAFPRDGNGLHEEGGLTFARILPQLADDLFLRPNLPPPPRMAQEIRHLIDEMLSESIGRTVEQRASRGFFPAFHRVRQAEEIIYANSDDPFSILDLARALGVSLRSLQLAFNQVHEGKSPRDVLNQIRLEKARQRLMAANGDVQVTTVALDSGFFHLSRFAQAYKKAFGERPSETLARRRA